jgi:hypothetical protein
MVISVETALSFSAASGELTLPEDGSEELAARLLGSTDRDGVGLGFAPTVSIASVFGEGKRDRVAKIAGWWRT